ncbi:MAG: PQQ-dependent sugar dehydrogenase [Candidatus Saccharimonadales bacterium]
MERGGRQRSWLYLGIFILAAVAAGAAIWIASQMAMQNVQQGDNSTFIPSKSTVTPNLTTDVVLGGRDHVWDIAFLPTKEMIFTERKGTVSLFKDGAMRELMQISDVYARGEGGLMGLAVDSKFNENHFIYTCFNSSKGAPDVRVVRWRLSDDASRLEERKDIIIGMPSNKSGRHSGCQLEFGPDGFLWVGTGDSAQNSHSQNPKSLGGKILRVDRDGNAASGNQGGQFDDRIYSYGHRNTQGLAFFAQAKADALGVSVEHGSTVDDEVNLLKTGNFGWAPPASYNESGVPMTDKKRFPDAVEAIWSSGSPTQAPSSAAFLKGRHWKAWDGTLAIAMLKGQHLKILQLDNNANVTKEEKVLTTFGRLRAVTQGPDGNLYISTDNGSGNDQIIRVAAS